MEKEFVTIRIALELKELSFKIPCFAVYDLENRLKYNIEFPFIKENAVGFTLAPLYQQAFDWFRIKYNLDSCIQRCGYGFSYQIYSNFGTDKNESIPSTGSWIEYEKAKIACLEKLIEIIKNETNEK